MIQFNLLPDVKLQFIKTRRKKRLVLVGCTLVSLTSFGIFLILLLITVGQRQYTASVDKGIKSNLKTLQSNQGLDKVLTVQNQLNSLSSLHDQKPVTSRIFGYLTQVTPLDATIATMSIDFGTSTIKLSGTASTNGSKNNLQLVNKFVDTLKFTDYVVGDSAATSTSKKAFSKVVLSSFGREEGKSSYAIDFAFDPAIFDVKQQVVLKVPSIISTRSVTEKPGALFDKSSQPDATGGKK